MQEYGFFRGDAECHPQVGTFAELLSQCLGMEAYGPYPSLEDAQAAAMLDRNWQFDLMSGEDVPCPLPDGLKLWERFNRDMRRLDMMAAELLRRQQNMKMQASLSLGDSSEGDSWGGWGGCPGQND